MLGVPVDAIDMETVLRRLEAAAAAETPFLLSTPNLNFLVLSQADDEFRTSLLESDLCPPDGIALVLLARLLGVPIRERVAGSDIFDTLRAVRRTARQLRVFLFGGAMGVVESLARTLNAEPAGLQCVGAICPGIGSVEDLSRREYIERINGSAADFLVLSLGAKKGQTWLLRHHRALRTPIRAHLGAAINFQAGTVKRAPRRVQQWGLEWLWRIKEEPHLWTRYWNDGLALLRLVLTHVVPFRAAARWCRIKAGRTGADLLIKRRHEENAVVLSLSGSATAPQVEKAASWFRHALEANSDVVLDLSRVSLIDSRFMGLILMLRKTLAGEGARLSFRDVPRSIRRLLRLNGFGYLLANGKAA